MPAGSPRINPIYSPLLLHSPARISGRAGKFGIEIGTEDEFQFFEQPDALRGPAAIEIGGQSARDVRPGGEHAPAIVFRQLRKRLGKHPIQVVDEGAAKFARQAVKSRVRRTARKYADKGRGLRLNARDPLHKPRDKGPAVLCSASRVQFLVRQPHDAILKLFDQRGDDVVLGFEELIDRADRDLGALRDQIGRKTVVTHLTQQGTGGLEDVSHPLPAARLGGKLAQAGALAACRIRHGLSYQVVDNMNRYSYSS